MRPLCECVPLVGNSSGATSEKSPLRSRLAQPGTSVYDKRNFSAVCDKGGDFNRQSKILNRQFPYPLSNACFFSNSANPAAISASNFSCCAIRI